MVDDRGVPDLCLEEWGGHEGLCNYMIMCLLRKCMCLPSAMVLSGEMAYFPDETYNLD